MARKSFSRLVEDHGQGSSSLNIAFGIRPSGTIHLGNMMTMALAVGLTRELGAHRTSLDVTLCDLDLPDAIDWNIDEAGYVRHYRDIADQEGCHNSMAEHAGADVNYFLQSLAKTAHIDYDIRTLTDVQRSPKFREGLKRVLDNPDAMKLIIPTVSEKAIFVYPLCPQCKASYTNNERGKKNTYDTQTGIIHTHCANKECSIEEFDVEVLDPKFDLSVHMFIDPLRDSVFRPGADIHVFGGDYSLPHGSNGIPKIDKVMRITEMATQSGRTPDYLVGPIIYARDGMKMSKSMNNGLTVKQLRDYLGEEFPERVLDFTMEKVRRGFLNIDFALINERLLGAR